MIQAVKASADQDGIRQIGRKMTITLLGGDGQMIPCGVVVTYLMKRPHSLKKI